ncbi:hypothetical protein J7I98_39240 [Streptomyces sp. ISL-98]|uniref:MAC/perforin domain-containing protein n=1 Tax=Streptomyces sp. ISL-98 TaxID=2819192 RepID=UPI001BEC7327|nr:MAC/perforin domain-containing protein [Streptomyces sp. ISL-98]MBT2511711.1 hypothetical protein [Streptomyces sp. ISL-98]
MSSTEKLAVDNTTKVVEVVHTSGDSRAIRFGLGDSLATVRATLENHRFMREGDVFLVNGKSPLSRSDEEATRLSEVLGKDNVLHIGTPSVDPSFKRDGVDRYNQLNVQQQKRLLGLMNAYRGRTFDPRRGMVPTFHDVCVSPPLPDVNRPQTSSEKYTSFTFSEFTRSLTVSGVQSASVSLNAPFVEAEAEYTHEKSKNTTRKTVTEHLTSRLLVRKAELRIDPERLVPDRGFVQAVAHSVDGTELELRHYDELLKVLDTWGFYVPVRYTIGGLVYATESTKITSYEESDKEKEEFGASVKAQFNKVGGGASYKEAKGRESSSSDTTKYQDTTLLALGGAPLTSTDDYKEWAVSLDNALNWTIIEYTELYPTLLLLRTKEHGDIQALRSAMKTIEHFRDRRPHELLDMNAYNTTVQNAVNPYP